MRQSFKLLDWSRRLATINTVTEPLNQDYHEKALLSFTSSPLEATTNNAHTDHPKQVRTPEQVRTEAGSKHNPKQRHKPPKRHSDEGNPIIFMQGKIIKK